MDGEQDRGLASIGPPSVEIILGPNYGKNLVHDFEDALHGDLDIKGKFYHSSHETLTPNPGLGVEGLGLIGLPLSSREARILIGYASANLQPSHNNQRDRSVWEVQADRVRFVNPEWERFIITSASAACASFGIPPWISPIECRLNQLLVLEAGARLTLPNHRQKERTFATLSVFLPSSNADGSLRLVRGSEQEEPELALKPFETSVFGWYANTQPEISPSATDLAMGYRILLTYDLIHPTTRPCPRAPTRSLSLEKVQHVMQNWCKSTYRQLPDENRLAILFEKSYPANKSRRYLAEDVLDRRDRKIYKLIETAAKSHGFTLFLGQLEYRIQWDDDSMGDSTTSKGDDGSSQEKVTIAIKDLCRGDGHILEGSELPLSEYSVVPKNLSSVVRPQWVCRNKTKKTVDQGFSRTAVLLARKDDEFAILQSADVSYCISYLKDGLQENRGSDLWSPTASDRMMAELALLRILDTTADQRDVIMRVCIKWNDRALWKRFIDKSGKTTSFFGADHFVNAHKTFTFQWVKPVLDDMIIATASVKDCIDLIQNIAESNLLSIPLSVEIEGWCTFQYKAALLSTLGESLEENMTEIFRIAELNGAEFLFAEFLPHIREHPPPLRFIHSFIKKLSRNPNLFASKHGNDLAVQCAQIVLDQPLSELYQIKDLSELYGGRLVHTLINVLDICLITKKFADCRVPLCIILHSDYLRATFDDLPEIMPSLQGIDFFQRVRSRILTTPFMPFLQAFIGLYFNDNFSRFSPAEEIAVDNIECEKRDCKYCRQVQEFIGDPSPSKWWVDINLKSATERKHIEALLLTAYKGQVKHEVKYQPFRIHLAKTSTLMNAQKQKAKVQRARTFLENIGPEATIKALMGDQYTDIYQALDGRGAFKAKGPYKLALGKLSLNEGRLEITANDMLDLTGEEGTSEEPLNKEVEISKGQKRRSVFTNLMERQKRRRAELSASVAVDHET